MTAFILPLVGILFFALAFALAVMAKRDRLGRMNIAGKVRTKLAMIFFFVGAGLMGYYLVYNSLLF